MHLVYYDESGDDGFPNCSSPLFVLSCIYLPAIDWRENFEILAAFRRQLAHDFHFPFKTELHTREFLLNKKPYRSLGLADSDRVEIVTRFCRILAQLNAKIINTVVVKPWISASSFEVLDKALSYSINRIENDLGGVAENRFLIITDEGRVGKMTATARRMQRINYLPSQFSPSSYRREIRHLIEDPLPKNSRQSWFIQLADMVACIVYLHTGLATTTARLPSRLPQLIDTRQIAAWLTDITPVLNLRASRADPHGIVLIPSSP